MKQQMLHNDEVLQCNEPIIKSYIKNSFGDLVIVPIILSLSGTLYIYENEWVNTNKNKFDSDTFQVYRPSL